MPLTQINSTVLDTLSGVNVTGNVLASSYVGGSVNVTGNVLASSYVGGSVNVTGNVLANTVTAWALGGTITTANQTNITRVGTLSNLSVTGNITVSSNVVFSGWSVRETGTKLYFAYNGVNKMSLDTGGNLVVTGDVTGFGTIT